MDAVSAAPLARRSGRQRLALASDGQAPEGRLPSLPEVFAGFPTALTSAPVAFPTASRPQAWAAGTPLLLLTSILNLQPGFTDVEADLPGQSGRAAIKHRPRPSETPSTPERSTV
jgi:glycogen debranching enzyme